LNTGDKDERAAGETIVVHPNLNLVLSDEPTDGHGSVGISTFAVHINLANFIVRDAPFERSDILFLDFAMYRDGCHTGDTRLTFRQRPSEAQRG
jgi:hypothetical protein